MARRSKKKVTLSLFPFLSILACVIGVLTLMITALALAQMDTESIASMFEYEQVRSKIQKEQEEIRRIQDAVDQKTRSADVDQQELARLREQLEELLQNKAELLKAQDQPVKHDRVIPQFDPAAHEKRMKEMQAELDQQEKAKKDLLEDVEKKSKREEAQVVIQPSGSGVGLEPTFVECDASGIVIYKGTEPLRVHRADLGRNEAFLALLKRVADQPNATVVFLIRDDGLSSYSAARNLAQSNYARNGKLPVIGHGKIDLSFFQRK